jgi:hypothetical protein
MASRTLFDTLNEMEILLSYHGFVEQAAVIRRLRDTDDPFDFGEMSHSLAIWGGKGSVVDVMIPPGTGTENRRLNELIVELEDGLADLGLSTPRAAQVARTIEDWLNSHPW